MDSKLLKDAMTAYQAVYDQDLREELEEEQKEIEEIGLQMIENASYVLFSQGYTVDDVISYFTEATENTVVEDFVNFAEGYVLIESVAVSDEYIEEQFEQLNEIVGAVLRGAAGLAGRAVRSSGNAAKRVFGSKKIEPVVVKDLGNKGGPLVKSPKGSLAKSTPTPVKSAAPAAKPNVFQKAAKFAGGVMNKVKNIPGAKAAARLGGKALPVAGAALYGADAVNRAKKGDWGGAALSGLGAGLSLAPGVGTLASLAPAGVQMATDAAGLTGDKSKKGGGASKPAPGAPKPKSGAGMVNVPGKGQRYYASSDKKYYKNYNDALAARNSRRGVKPPTTKPTSTPSATSKPTSTATSRPTSTPTATSKPSPSSTTTSTSSDTKLSPMDQWAKANPRLAKAQEIRKSGGSRAEVNKVLYNKGTDAAEKTPTVVKASFDMFDVIKGHLLDEGYADTEESALVIMANMSEEWRQSIIEAEVLAQKGGVAGSVKVKPTLSIPGTSIGVGPNRPVPGTFTTTTPEQRQKISQGDTTIDRGTYKQSRVGAGPTANERQRYNTQLTLTRTPGKLMSR